MKKSILHTNIYLFSNIFSHWPLIIVSALLLLLLARNPFSDRTLIPNFEPFPDTFHYITPIRCWLAGEGWTICREGRSIAQSVPPGYSLVLLPAFLILNDPRMFYLVNVVLAFVSLLLLYAITKKLKLYPVASFLILFVFATNFHTYWVPTLAMAENALIPVFLALILLCLYPVSTARSVMVGILTAGLYGIKYSAAPLIPVFGLLYLIKILRQREETTTKIKEVVIFGAVAVISLFLLTPSIFTSAIGTISAILPQAPTTTEGEVANSSWAISLSFFSEHAPQYFSVIWGNNIRYLWDLTPLIARWLGGFGLAGLVLGLTKKKYRYISVVLLSTGLAQLLFMSIFYVVDARYVHILFPILLIGVAVLLAIAQELVEPLFLQKKYTGVVIIALIVLAVVQFPRIKSQIGLNLKYAETPWWYLSIQQMNNFFASQQRTGDQRPIVITAIPVFLVDFYSTGTYQLLPLSTDHDFRDKRKELFGDYDYSDLLQLYDQQLAEGKELYVTNYGLGNEQPRIQDFENLKNNFELELLQTGCHELCNVWRVVKRKNNRPFYNSD